MIEILVSIFVAAIVFLIYRRYGGIFSLPFFWTAVFSLLYVGLLQIHAESGSSSYQYAAAGFGMFFLGLLAADFLLLYRTRTAKIKIGRQPSDRNIAQSNPKPDTQPKPTRIKLLFPTLPLKVGLSASLLAATIVTFVYFGQTGIPIFSSFPALAWVEATSGIVNRLMSVFGPGCYATLGLVAWALHRQTGHRGAKALMYLGLGLAVLSDALLASKASAIIIFIWFNILLFYSNKKREFRKSLLPLLIIIVPISAGIVGVRMMSTIGYWHAGSIYQTFYDRITIEPAEPLDYIFKYSNRFGPMRGGAMHRELARMKDQLTGQHKTPLLSEFIYDLLNGLPQTTTGLSAALTLQGTGYVEWGMAGLLLYSFLQGLGFGWIHRYLLRLETMSVVMLVFWGSILNYVMAASLSGTILVGLESAFMDAIPPLLILFPFCLFFLLPMARRYRAVGGRRISRVPQA